MGLRELPAALTAFAAEVGTDGPVAVEGGRTQWSVGGGADPSARLVRAPTGVLAVEPAEMTVRVLAGTPVAELQAVLAEVGQCVNLPGGPGEPGRPAAPEQPEQPEQHEQPEQFDRPGRPAGHVLAAAGAPTVGGVVAVGRSGLRRLGWGPLRDAILQVRYVSAEGLVVTGGGPTVKNVTGFDLPRLLVGSLGTLGLLGELILRTRPLPARERWLTGPADPFALRDRLHRPAALLWDGTSTWLLLSGYEPDVDADTAIADEWGMAEAPGPPPLPSGRRSLRPRQLRDLATEGRRFVAEIGVGVAHVDDPVDPPPLTPAVAELHRRLKRAFDPRGRLNPGRDPALR